MKKLLRTINRERGLAPLAIVLVLMLMGTLTLPALLRFVGTGLKTEKVIEEKALEYYAADAGVEDALWRIKNDRLPDWMLGDWGESAYNHEPYSPESDYPVLDVNARDVEVSIQPRWVLEGLEEPSPGQERNPRSSLVTVGDVIDRVNSVYQISMIHDGSIANLKVERIGCWFPAGFEYVDGSSNLEEFGQPYYCVPEISPHHGGIEITWNYSPAIDYSLLPSQGSKKIVTFQYMPDENPQGAFSWMRTNQGDPKLSWDVDIKLYEVTSQAISGSGKYTEVTAYTTKNEFRMFGSAMAGDYQSAGNTLMRDSDSYDSKKRRDRLYKETSATVNVIPADAVVQKIFLYWSGWKCKPWYAWNLTEAQRQALPADKGVNKIALQVEVGSYKFATPQVITASASQVLPNGTSSSQHGWSYSCYADITTLVTDFFKGQGVNFVGNAKYTLGHWSVGSSGTGKTALYEWKDSHSGESVVGYTLYPLGSTRDGNKSDLLQSGYWENSGSQDEWAYSAWSVVIIYSSPSTKGHQLYMYDTFRYCDMDQTLIFTISGFLAPQDVLDDPEAARLTCFLAEGDEIYSGDSIKVNDVYLSDPPTNPWNNVWNSKSNLLGGGTIDGVDIDTYTGGNGIIQPGDSEAEARLPTGTDSWNLVYIVLSFRSEITVGGTLAYKVEVGGE